MILVLNLFLIHKIEIFQRYNKNQEACMLLEVGDPKFCFLIFAISLEDFYFMNKKRIQHQYHQLTDF
jgi:hypothetical protein